ncbi:MAG: SelL-related redox protein [Chitinophagales bacterium]|jgi:peroxiredoxin|nr:redoxin family protein [Bacteroidota bacterium]MBK9555192.1 redoxin family protein [Bacteroidota bacterium]MBL0279514.1 redoxin family protein [Bacteroidota bacterium]MBP8249698.1 redoxin family protein [Chitinophagales bacterium]MBP9879119.1 redoxin family protein [Chitinophagales bacterium]
MIAIFKSKLNASLFISAIYFVIWSLVVIMFPSILNSVVIEQGFTPVVFWDFMSLVTFILGIGLFIAAGNPHRHWPIILMVSLFHLAMIGGFVFGYTIGFFNNLFIRFIILNHLIWLIPNAIVLYKVYRRSFETDEMLMDTFSSEQYPLSLFDTTDGRNLGEMHEEKPLMLVFLRHFGCPFCKESLLQLAEHRRQLEAEGIGIVLVYMVDDKTAEAYLTEYGLNDVAQVSDPEEIFYKSFRLKRGSFLQLFGLKVWVRWVELAFRKKLFNTKPAGDVAQMPGIFLLQEGKVVKEFVHKSVADSPDYTFFLNYRENSSYN